MKHQSSRGSGSSPRRSTPAADLMRAAEELRQAAGELRDTARDVPRLMARAMVPAPPPRGYQTLPSRPFEAPLGYAMFRIFGARFLREFLTTVPASHLENGGAVVRCSCGGRVELEEGGLESCPGAGCERWFMRTSRDVRVAYWPEDDRVAEAA